MLTPEGFIKDLATLERATADPSGSKSGTTRSAPEAVERPSKTSGRTAAMQQGLPTPSAREAAARTSQTSRYDSSESSGNRYAQWQDQREGSGRPSAPPPSQGSYRGASPAPTHTYNSSFSSGGGDGNRSSLRPPQGSQGGSHRMGPPLSNASSVSSLNSTPDKPKKKGLFGRLK